jgi:hypothetical protein
MLNGKRAITLCVVQIEPAPKRRRAGQFLHFRLCTAQWARSYSFSAVMPLGFLLLSENHHVQGL